MKRIKHIVVVITGWFLMAGCLQHGSLPFYNSSDFTPLWNTDTLRGSLHRIPDFSLTDQNNLTITSETFKGKIYIANFFFTGCGVVCPTMTKNLLNIQKQFPADERIAFLSHTVTPWVDSTARLKSYAAQYDMDNRWHLVTGNQSEIYQLARQSYFAEEAPGFDKDSTDFLHTEHVLLIDTNKHIRGVYNGTLALEIDRLAEDVKVLLEEQF